MHPIVPSLWFDHNAEEAVEFYVSVFPGSSIGSVLRYDEAGAQTAGRTAGEIMSVNFVLNGQDFTAINGGPMFTFTPAISFMIQCATQEEVDAYWGALTEGGTEEPCGWLRDRYGVSWQVVPAELFRLLGSPDRAVARRVTEAMLRMKKIDLVTLRRAAGTA